VGCQSGKASSKAADLMQVILTSEFVARKCLKIFNRT
jgi:hypothetical protein